MPLKQDTKKTPFCMSYIKRTLLRKVNNYESDNFEMEILDESVLDKAVENLKKKKQTTIYEVICDEYFKPLDVKFPKDLPL